MFICPICKKEFEKEESIRSHFLSCYSEHHPYHKAKSVPRIEKTTREVSADIADFFERINK